MKTRTFVDHVTLYVKAGNGGNGSRSFRREKYIPKGGPDGGDGGRGGHVFFVGDKDVDSLLALYYVPHQKAGHGGNGLGQKMFGKKGEDLYLKIPLGTEVRDKLTDVKLVDIVEHGQTFMIARGGDGGLGNVHWKSSVEQAPTTTKPGELGVELDLYLVLKIMADVGLVGFPNAGKSSLLCAISHAHPKVGAYPFTTLNPVIGTLVFADCSKVRMADIPGLIEGAHKGVGLGHAFLRHIERSKILVFIMDMAGVDEREPWEDFLSLRRELEWHDATLLERPFLVVANKMDLPEAAENIQAFIEKTGFTPLEISAEADQGLTELKAAIFDKVCELVANTDENETDPLKRIVLTHAAVAKKDIPKPGNSELPSFLNI